VEAAGRSNKKLGTGKATDTDLYIDDEGDDDIQLQDASGSGPRRHGTGTSVDDDLDEDLDEDRHVHRIPHAQKG